VAELSLEERLQPSLLDRLTDEEPNTGVEPRSKRVLSINKLRRSVLRDLAWLMNSGSMDMTEDLAEVPEVENSVLNYGVRHLAGTTVSSIDTRELEQDIRNAILRFEPRILPESLTVTIDFDKSKMARKTMSFIIEGQLWAQPLPINLFLSTDLDLETGAAVVTESSS
jgi:type VI secretion system protein ImpF